MINKVAEISEPVMEDMEIGDMDLEGLKATCSHKIPTQSTPQQVSFLEKVIFQDKNMNSLGVVVESLKDTDGKKKLKKEKWGRPRNVQRIKVIGEKLMASWKYPTIDVSLSPSI